MRKNFKSVTIPLSAYNEIKTLGTSKIFEVPLSVSKTIVWLLEKQKAHHNKKMEKRKYDEESNKERKRKDNF